MKKNLLTVLVAGMLALSAAACSSGGGETTGETGTTGGATEELATEALSE